jgi:hypothetical protein
MNEMHGLSQLLGLTGGDHPPGCTCDPQTCGCLQQSYYSALEQQQNAWGYLRLRAGAANSVTVRLRLSRPGEIPGCDRQFFSDEGEV